MVPSQRPKLSHPSVLPRRTLSSRSPVHPRFNPAVTVSPFVRPSVRPSIPARIRFRFHVGTHMCETRRAASRFPPVIPFLPPSPPPHYLFFPFSFSFPAGHALGNGEEETGSSNPCTRAFVVHEPALSYNFAVPAKTNRKKKRDGKKRKETRDSARVNMWDAASVRALMLPRRAARYSATSE